MSLEMIPLREEMSGTLATIYLDAFADISINRIMIPVRDEAVHEGFTKLNKAWIQKQRPNEYFFAIVDPSTGVKTPGTPEGEVIAVGKWRHEKANDQEPHEVDTVEIPGANIEARSEFFGVINRQRAQAMAGKDYMHLLFLSTAPKHHGRGAGRLIMDFGVKMADELGLPSYLDATPQGRFLYEKYGFEMTESTKIDLRKYGANEDYATCCMIRPARKAQ